MRDFVFYSPTKMLFGRGVEQKVGLEIKAFGGKKALVHYGGGSAEKSGVLSRICAGLEQAGVEYVLLGGVQPNPVLSMVRKGIALCKSEGVDFLLAVGGGSVIDSAKAIALGVANDCDVWDFFIAKPKVTGCLPVGAVLTIAAAGSESSDSTVITNEEGMYKRAYGNDIVRPRFAALNPELTFTLPPYQTACGIVDILMHTLERYFSNEKGATLTDGIAETLLRDVMAQGLIVMKEPQNYEARAQIMWAGSLSHNGLTGVMKVGDWGTHRVQMELSALFGVAHGAGLAAVWGSWARYVLHHDVALFAQFAQRVMGCERGADDEQTALRGIEAMERYFVSLNMPVIIRQLVGEISDEQIRLMAQKCVQFGSVGNFVPLGFEEAKAIYELAR